MKQHARRGKEKLAGKAEAPFPTSKERFRELLASAFDIVCELDAEGRCLEIGQNCGQVLGLSADDVKGRSLFDCINPADRDAVADVFYAVLAGEPRSLIEFRCAHRDGRWVWLEGTMCEIPSDSGQLQKGVLLVARDIDKRKRYEFEQSTLISLAKDVNARADLSAITREIERHLKPLLPFNTVLIALNDKEELVFVSHTLKSAVRVPRRENFNHPAWQALMSRKPWVANEWEVPPALLESVPEAAPLLAAKSTVFAFIKIPLIIRDDVIGVLCFESHKPHVFTEEHARLARMAAEQVAIAVHQVRLLEKALRAERKYRALVYDLDAIVWEAVPDTQAFTFVNPQAQIRLGYSLNEWLETPDFWAKRIHPEDRDWVLAARRAAIRECRDFQLDYRVLTATDQVLWLRDLGSIESRAQPDGSRKPIHVRGLMVDITERKRVELALIERNTILKAVQEAATDGICVMDTLGNVVSTNRHFMEMWSLSDELLDELIERNQIMSWIAFKAQDPSTFIESIEALATNPSMETHDELRLKNGCLFECYSTPALAEGGRSFGRVWSFRDITAREQFEQQLAHQAFHDALTELPNRALFLDRLEHSLSRSRRAGTSVGVLFLDLDRFKIINDSLGHAVGDDLLKQVADRLRHTIRPNDTAARFGGDEFTILVEDVTAPDEATHVARRIFEEMKAPFKLAGREIHMSASIGISLSTSARDTADELLRKADVAMYSSKGRGAGGYELFHSKMNGQSLERLQLEIDLRQAVRLKQLRLCYQPLVHLETGRIIGAEALLRWEHPSRGVVDPEDFIPIAEETGMILPIGRWVLRQACSQARRWQREFPGNERMKISINISVRQLEQSELVAEVREVLQETELEPGTLGLEITESAVMKNVQSNIRQLEEIRKLGVKLAIDDFGTGYSSLSYLEKFPLDILKIDRSFVEQVSGESRIRTPDGGTDGLAILEAMSNLGQTLGVSVIAEGIETAEQRAQLRALSCEYGQGFYFSRPLELEEINSLLLSNSRL